MQGISAASMDIVDACNMESKCVNVTILEDFSFSLSFFLSVISPTSSL